MALIITDTGIASDDANLEHQLSVATKGLMLARDFTIALAVGVLGVGIAGLVRLFNNE